MAARIRCTGRVVVLYVGRDATHIKLDNDDADGPKENLWTLPLDHTNYQPLYALALAAAANRWPLTIRIAGDDPISPERPGRVAYMVVEWRAEDA